MKIIVLLCGASLMACACAGSYTTKIISDPPGAKIELDGNYIGETPCDIEWLGRNINKTLVGSHTLVAHPVFPGQETQVKKFRDSQKIPRTIYFNMNLVRSPHRFEIDFSD